MGLGLPGPPSHCPQCPPQGGHGRGAAGHENSGNHRALCAPPSPQAVKLFRLFCSFEAGVHTLYPVREVGAPVCILSRTVIRT